MFPSDARARLRALEKVGHIYSHALGVVRSCRTAVHAFKTVAERGPWVAELSAAHARHEVRSPSDLERAERGERAEREG